MLEIILVRHGETDWNTGEIFRGRVDVELNNAGIKQAELLGGYLGGETIDFIYSSPLKRAVRTAEAIALPKKLDVNIVENLNDIDLGEWQGQPLREVEEKYPELYRDWLDTPEQLRIPGGECLADVRSRAFSFVEDAVTRCGEGRVVFVSHRVVLKVLTCALLGVDNSYFWKIRLDTAGLSRFECGEGRLVMTAHNDTSYLRSIDGISRKDF